MKTGLIEEIKVKVPFLTSEASVFTRDNGHQIIAIHKPGELVNISTWIKTGSINEDSQINGISHFLEHLMFKGTKRFKAGEFDKKLESKGAIINAATWKDYTFYYVTIPKGKANEQFLEALDLHSDMMLNACFPDIEIGAPYDYQNPDPTTEKKERAVVVEEIGMREDQPWTITYNAVNKLMYNDHPYKRDVIGTRAIISSISRDTIENYYKKWYTPQNSVTVVVGDLDPQYVYDLVSEKFNYTNTNNHEPYAGYVETITEQREVLTKGDVTTSFIIVGYHGTKASDIKGTVIMDVMSTILGENKSSRLIQNLIEKNPSPIFNFITSSHYTFRDGNTFFIQGNFAADKEKQAKQDILDQIQQLQDHPVSEQELHIAKRTLEVNFAEEAETVSNIGESIGHYTTVHGDIHHYLNYLHVLKSISAEDIQKAAQHYFSPQKACISTLIPAKKG